MELAIFSTPLGRYYDCYPLHILSSNALDKLKALEPEGHFIPQRFRPNIFIESAQQKNHFDEFDWLDGQLHIGDTIIHCESKTIRYLMPAQPQTDCSKNSKTYGSWRNITADIWVSMPQSLKRGRFMWGIKSIFRPVKKALLHEDLRLFQLN